MSIFGTVFFFKYFRSVRLLKEDRMNKVLYATLVASVVALPSSVFAQAAVVTVPSEVETYVVQEKTPSVKVEREVIVGSELPGTIELHAVPKFNTYSYAVVNNKRVIVEAKTRKVIKVID
jgi:adenosylcobinamide amidohydrolase